MTNFAIKTKALKIVLSATLSGLLLCSCSDMFQERVPMQVGGYNSTLLTLFNSTVDIEKLESPNQVFVTNGESSDKIIVTWKSVEGAKSYKLERAVSLLDQNGNCSVPSDGDFETLEHSSYIDGTSYTDIIIDNTPSNLLNYTNEAYSYAYFYRVSAENNIDNYEPSDTCPITDPGPKDKPNPNYSESKIRACSGILLAPPKNVKASCGSSKTEITVSWTRPKGSIASYRIYRSSNPDGSGASQVATVYGNSVSTSIGVSSEQQGASFYFYVVSVGDSGNESVASSIAMGYTLKDGAPSQVTGVMIKDGEGRGQTKNKISIKWNAAIGDSSMKYSVYRYSSVDATLKLLTPQGQTETEFDDTTSGLKPNVFYYYQVQAWSKKGDETLLGQMSASGNDAEKPEDIAEGYLLSPPKSITVKKDKNNAAANIIVFSAAIGSEDCSTNTDATIKKNAFNTYSYIVYGSDTAAGAFTEVAPLEPQSLARPGYYQVTVPNKKFYKMATKNGSVLSADSSIVAPSPNPAKNLKATKNGFIDGWTDNDANANANGVHAIKLTWQAPDGGADGGYHIYRSTNSDTGFKKITESPVTDLFYIYKDEQAKAGNYYYYRVVSLNSLGQGDNDNPSNTDYGYGALTTYQYVREYIKTTLNSQKKLTLMHKSAATDKLGTDNANGDISGNLSYDASMQGLGGRVIMHYTNYADFYIMNDKNLGVYFLLNGNTNTTANISSNGTMDGTVTVQGMYPGSVVYDAIQIKGGAAGGGTYGVTRNLIKDNGQMEKITVNADWTWGEK